MSPKKNIYPVVLRIALCFLSLPLLFAAFTSKASLQNANVTVRAVNAATPRRSPRPANIATTTNTYRRDAVPAPTPPENSTVRGRVFYADTGRAVKRAVVVLMSEEGGGLGGAPTAITDGDGNFQIKKVRAGVYYPLINAPGVVSPIAFLDFSRESEREGMKGAFEGFEKIVVDGVSDADVQIPAQRGGAIGGRVMYDDGDAAIGVRVEILRKVKENFVTVIPNLSVISSMMSGGNQFQTDDRGVYRFAGLPPGDYIVKVTESTTHGDLLTRNYSPFEPGYGGNSFLTVFFPDAGALSEAQLINVQLGQEIGEINLTLPSRNLYELTGRVIEAKTKTPVRARLIIKRKETEAVYTLFNRQQPPNASLTDENGNWKFKQIPKGVYKIIVEPIEDETDYRRYTGDYSVANSAPYANKNAPKLAKKIQEMTIDDGERAETIIELGFGATLSGSVAVENSEEMPPNVLIFSMDENDDAQTSTNVLNYRETNDAKPTKINHDFKIEGIAAGKNYLGVGVSDDDYYVKSATLGGVDLLGSPFDAKEGETLRGVQIVLGKDTGVLKGAIVNDQKQPVSGIELTIVPTDAAARRKMSFYRRATSGTDGEFEIKAAPGEYAVVFYGLSLMSKSREEILKRLDEAVRDAQIVKIETGKTATVTIKKKD